MAASSGLKSVDAGLMCVYVLIFVFDPLEFCYGTPIHVSYILVLLSLQAALEIWEHQHNIIFHFFVTMMYVYVHVPT
jgi:hypothetical protein